MGGVLIGFAIIGAIIAAGYGVGRAGLLGPHAQFVMSRLAFFVLMPCLLFHTIATADIASLVSPMLWVSLLSAVVVAIGTAAVFGLVLRRSVTVTTVGALPSATSTRTTSGCRSPSTSSGRPRRSCRSSCCSSS